LNQDKKYTDYIDYTDLENLGKTKSGDLISESMNTPHEILNQYSKYIPQFVFLDYKEAILLEDKEKMREIEEYVYAVCRKVNELPRNLITAEDVGSRELSTIIMTNMLKPLGSVELSKGTECGGGIGSCYNGEDYGLNNAGIDFLYSFFPNIWDVTKKTAPMSVRQGFYNDDKLKKSIKKTLTYSDSILDLIKWLRMAGLGYCVNFRPAVAKSLYEAHAPENAKVYDYANGYGARCLGAMLANNVAEYVSVDVNTETVESTHRMVKEIMENPNLRDMLLINDRKIVPYLCGSEEFLQKYPEYKGYFDLSFSSPQYFNTEIYSQEDTQSCHKYPQYKIWLRDFYRPTIHNSIDVLKEGGVFIINIFEKLPEIAGAGEGFDLKKMTKTFAAEKGFYCYKSDKYLLRTMPGAGKRIIDENGNVSYEKRDRTIGLNYEAVWMFRHYKDLRRLTYITEEQYQVYEKRHNPNKEEMAWWRCPY